MTNIFGGTYADAYDLLYQDKDYGAECDLIERVFANHGSRQVKRVLDLGCGTGNHSIALARRGYQVVGVDASPEMLARASKKVVDLRENASITFRSGDVRTLRLKEKFDAVLIMFAVLSYQLTDADVLATLATAREHVDAGGLLIFDIWYGPGVLKQGPTRREKIISTADAQIARTASGELDALQQMVNVQYHLSHSANSGIVNEITETHTMRFFFPRELERFLTDAGFGLIRLAAFPEFDRQPDESDWNAMVTARAC